MKKFVTFILILLLTFSLTAATNDLFTYWQSAFRPSISSMGNAGLFLDRTENVYRNPSMVDTDWHVVLPSVSVRLYGIERNKQVFNDLFESIPNGGNMVPAAVGFLNNLPGGFKDFVELDGYMYIGAPYVGFSSDFGFGLMTVGNGDVTSKIVAHVNAAFTLSGAYEIDIADGYSVSLGLGMGARYKMASMDSEKPYGIGVETVSEVIENAKQGLDIPGAINELFKNDVDYSTGWSFPMSLGATFRFPYGFSAGITVSNLNGAYHMYSYNEMDDAWSSDFGSGRKGVPFTLKSNMDVSTGVAWEMDSFLSPYWLRLSAALDFTDIIGFWKNQDYSTAAGWVEHVRMGAEVSFLTAFELRAGLDEGYFTAGAGINLWGNRLDFVYGVKPYGKVIYGDALDYLAVVFTLGWENY